MVPLFRFVRLPGALALLSLAACSGEQATPANDSAAAQPTAGSIPLTADNSARLGL